MARTPLTVQTITSAKGTTVAADLAKTFTAGDVANGNEYSAYGREIVTVRNSHATTPYDLTIDSVPDPLLGRDTNLVVEVAAGTEQQVILPRSGFVQTTGKVHLDVENAALLLNVSRPPDTF